jgi:hypothetical protein
MTADGKTSPENPFAGAGFKDPHVHGSGIGLKS